MKKACSVALYVLAVPLFDTIPFHILPSPLSLTFFNRNEQTLFILTGFFFFESTRRLPLFPSRFSPSVESQIMTVNKALEEMEVKRFQLSIPYLLQGYYPCYSLTIAGAGLLISSALAVGTGSCAQAAPALLFRSFTSFCATSVVLLMISALFYRVCGGSYAFSSQSISRQVDWAYEVILKENAQRVVPWLVNCSRAERICLVAAVAIVGEVGKLMSFWAFMACAFAGWAAFLLVKTFSCHAC